MSKKIGTLWFVVGKYDQNVVLSKGYTTKAEADAVLALFTGVNDPIVRA